jgi:membrane protease YdiL (CAAX protease family)
MTTTEVPVPGRPLLRRLFDNRLLRLATLFVATLAAYAGAQILPMLAAPHVPPADRALFAVAAEAASVVLLLLIYGFLVRRMEHRPASEIGLRKAPAILSGAVVGFGLFCAVVAILTLLGAAHVHGYTPGRQLLPAANMAVLSAVGEEIAFRGVVFRILEEMFGSAVALLVSAGFFGLIHLGNPGATWVSAIAIALEAGLLLGAAYMAVRNLWLPIGLHFGWNFTESGIFGSVVSGNAFKGLFATTLSGSDLLTGGAFGPEASVVAVAVCAAAALVFLAIAVRRGQWAGLRLSIRAQA